MENKLEKSQIKIIASTNVFQIEFVEKLGKEDYPPLINISLRLAKEYGRQAVLTKNTIEKYFDGEKSLPFIARYQNEIIGYIIGIPLEELREENWAVNDKNFGKYNTLYTYAFVIQSEYKGNGYAKMLKRVFLSWAKKRKQTEHITGHVVNGISARFTGDIKIVNRIDNWQGTGKSFEYYRRDLIAEQSSPLKNNPPLITRT